MQQIIELITVINNEQSYLGLQELEKQINKITNIDIKVNPIETKSVEKSVKQLNNLLLRNPLKIKVDDTRLFELNDHYDEKIVDHNKVVDNAENNPIKIKYTEEDKTTDKGVNNKKESSKTESDKKENKFQEDRLAHVLQSIIDEGIKDGVNLMLRGLPPAISKAIANPFTNFLQGFTGGLGNDVLQWVKGKVNQNINKPQTAEIIDFPQLNQSTSGGELTRYNPKIDGGNGVIDVDFSEIKSKEKAESNIINFPDNFKAKTIIVDSLKVQNLRNFKLPPSVKNIQVKDENVNSLNRGILKDSIDKSATDNDNLDNNNLDNDISPLVEKLIEAIRLNNEPDQELIKEFQSLKLAINNLSSAISGEAKMMSVDLINADPKRFQYKMMQTNQETGSTNSLQGVTKDTWDHAIAGAVTVWKDPKDNKYYVINGHNRLAKAKEVGIDNINVQEIHSKDAQEARAKGALQNIAQGNGTLLDTAKFFRDFGIRSTQDIQKAGIPLSQQNAAKALGIAKLPDYMFNQLVTGELPQERASLIGNSGLNQEDMTSLYEQIKSIPKINNDTIAELIDNIKASKTEQLGMFDLLGVQQETDIAPITAQLKAKYKKHLSTNKKIFGQTAKNASQLTQANNVIDVQSSQKIAQNSESGLMVFDRLKNLDTELSRVINASGKAIAEGADEKTISSTMTKFLDAVMPNIAKGDNFARLDDSVIQKWFSQLADKQGNLPENLELIIKDLPDNVYQQFEQFKSNNVNSSEQMGLGLDIEAGDKWQGQVDQVKDSISELEKFSAKKGYEIQKNLASGSPGLIPEILARWTKATPKFEAILKDWDKISAEYGDRINLNLINDFKKYNQDFAEKIESRAKTPQQVKREQATTAFSSANFDEGEIISKKGKKARKDSLPKLETNRKKRKESFAQDIENRASTKDRIRREQIINAFLNAEMIDGEILSEQERRSRQEKLPKLTDKPEDYSRAFAKNIQNRQLSRKEQALRAFGEAEYDSMGFAMPQQRRMEMSPQPNHVLRLIDSINNLIDSIDKAQSQLLLPSQQMRLKESEAYKKNQQLSNDLGFFVETDLQRTVEQSRLKNITDESEVINRKPKSLPPVDEMLRVVEQGREIRNTDLWDLPIEPKQKPQYPDNYLKERQKRLKNLVLSANLDLQNLPYSNKQLKNQKLLPSAVSTPNTVSTPVTVEVVNTQDILSTDLWTDEAINVPKFVPDSPILMREGEKKNRELLSRKYGFFVEPYLQQKPYQPEEIPDFWNQELPKLKRPLPYTVNDKGEYLKQFAENIANRLNEQELLDDQGLPPEVVRRRRQARKAFTQATYNKEDMALPQGMGVLPRPYLALPSSDMLNRNNTVNVESQKVYARQQETILKQQNLVNELLNNNIADALKDVINGQPSNFESIDSNDKADKNILLNRTNRDKKDKQFKLSSLNTRGNIGLLDQNNSQKMIANIRRLSRDLQRAVSLGFEDTKGDVTKQVAEIKAQLESLSSYDASLNKGKAKIEKLEGQQSYKKEEQQKIIVEIEELKAKKQLSSTSDVEIDKLNKQINSKQQDLNQLINEQLKIQQLINRQSLKNKEIEFILTRKNQELSEELKNAKKNLENAVLESNPQIFRQMEDRINRASAYQAQRQVGEQIGGTRAEQTEAMGLPVGYLVSLGAAFAPVETTVLSLVPVLINLIPTIAGIAGAFNMLSPVVNQARENMLRLSTIQNRFNVVSVDKNVKSAEFDYVRNLSRDLSLNAEVLTEQYTKLYSASVGTRMQGAELKQLFEGVATSVRALNLTTYESELVFNAYSQILSKGKLSMEELRQQLGEKFPPAMSIFAKSLGVSVGELDALTSRGALLSDEVLPKIAKTLKQDYGGIVEKSFGSFSSQLAKLENEIFNFNINLVNTFEGTFSAITGLMASVVKTVNDAYGSLAQYFSTSVIGITAILAAGTSAVTKIPQVAKALEAFSSMYTTGLNTVGKLILPTVAGIAVDAVPFLLGAENSVMENMIDGLRNMIETSTSGYVKEFQQIGRNINNLNVNISQIIPDINIPVLDDFISNVIENAKNLGKFLKDSLGTVELFALVFMFEQLGVLLQLYVIPQIMKLGTGFTNLFKNIRSGSFNFASLKAMMTEILPLSTRINIGILALEAGIADLIVSFAKGDMSNPLYDTLNSTYKSTNNLTDALSGLVKEFASLNNEVKQFNKLTPKGFETSFKAKYLGDKTKSKLSDELVTSAPSFMGNDVPVYSQTMRVLALPANAFSSLLGSEVAKFEIAKTLGAGGQKVTNLQKETLTKNNLENFIPNNNLETIALRNLVFDLDTGEKTLKDFQADIDKIGFNPDKLGANIPKIKATITDVINSINEDLYKKSGLDESLINEFKTLDSIEKIDAKLLELGQKRVPLALDGTPTALQEIRKIDVQLRALENVRKNAVIEVVTKTEQLDEYEKTIKDTIEEIERQNDPFEVEQAKIKPYQEILDIIQKIRQELDKGGVSDLLKPLEDVFQKVKITVGDSQTLFDKFIQKNKIGLSNDIAEIYQSNPVRQQVSALVDSKTLARNRDELAKVTEQLNLLIEQRKILEALPIGAEGDPRSEEKQNIKDEINRLKEEQATLGQTVAQSNYELAESIRQQRISARDFTRQLVDFDLQVKDYFINRSRQLQDFEKNFTDTSIQNQRGTRDLVESFRDLRNTLNTNILNINNQLITAKNQLSNLSDFNEIRSNFKLGSNGLLNQFTTLLEGIFTSEESLNEQTRNLEEERLALQQETTDYTRQIRGLGEQAYDLERDRINQLIDLTRQQDDFIKEQNNSWRDITKTAEDLAVSAKEWGVQFTSIADILINITGMYERLQSQINDSVNNMQTATSVLPYADSVKVGKLGSTGSSTAPHLHFEVIAPSGQALNPKNTDYYNKVMIGDTAINQMGINSGHGMRKHPIKGIQKFHTGIDVGGQNNLGQNITLNIPTSEIKKIEQKNDVGGYGKYTDVTLMNDYKLRFAHLLEHGKQLTEITSNLTKATNNFNRDDAKSIASAFIKQEEGFRDKAYFDVNRYRIGYGTEFKGNSPNSYRASSTITKAEADNQLENYDIPRFTGIVKSQLGDTFNQLSEQIKASLISVSYNYGSLPSKVVNAVKTKNTATIANSIRTLQANPERRNREADLVLSSSQNKIKGVAPNDRTTNQHSNLSSISSRNSVSNISSSSEFKSVEKQIEKVITTFPDTVNKAIENVDRPTVKSLIEFLDKGQKIPTDLLREVLNLKDMGNYEGALELMKTQVKDFTQLKTEFINVRQKQVEEQRIAEEFQKAQELRQNVITVNETIRNIENNYTQLQQSIKQAQIETQGFTTTQQSLDMAVFETKNKYRDLRQQVRSFGKEIENSLDVINLDNLDKAKEDLTLLKDKLALNLGIIPDGQAKEKMQEFIGLIEKGLAENVNATELLITLKAKFDKLGLEEQLNQMEKEAEITVKARIEYETSNKLRSDLSNIYSNISNNLKEFNLIKTATNFEINARELESLNKYNQTIFDTNTLIQQLNQEIAENPANKEYLEAYREQLIKVKSEAERLREIEKIEIPIKIKTENAISEMQNLSNTLKSIGERKAEVNPFFGGSNEQYLGQLLEVKAKYKSLEQELRILAQSEQNVFDKAKIEEYRGQLGELEQKELRKLEIKMSKMGQLFYEPFKQATKDIMLEVSRGTKRIEDVLLDFANSVLAKLADMASTSITDTIFDWIVPKKSDSKQDSKSDLASFVMGELFGKNNNGGGNSQGNGSGYRLEFLPFTNEDKANSDLPFTENLSNSVNSFTQNLSSNSIQFAESLSQGSLDFSNAIASSTDILSSSLGNFLNGILSGGGGGGGLFGTLASSALSGITGGIVPSFGGGNYSFAEGIKLKGYSVGGMVEKIPMINNFSQGGKVQEVMIPNFSTGGEIMPQIENFSDGGQVQALKLGLGMLEAMKREGANAVPVVAYAGESFLSHKTGDAQLYEDLKRTGVWDMFKHNPSDIPDVKNYEYGGTVERTYSKMTNNSSTNTYNNSRSKETNNNSRTVENHNYYFQNKDPFVGSSSYLKQRQKLGR